MRSVDQDFTVGADVGAVQDVCKVVGAARSAGIPLSLCERRPQRALQHHNRVSLAFGYPHTKNFARDVTGYAIGIDDFDQNVTRQSRAIWNDSTVRGFHEFVNSASVRCSTA